MLFRSFVDIRCFGRAEIKSRFERGQIVFFVEKILTVPDITGMLDRQTVGRLHQFANPPVIFVYMNVFVPFYHDHCFGVVDMRHGRLRHNAEHQHAKGNGEQQKQKGDGFMTEDPFIHETYETNVVGMNNFLNQAIEVGADKYITL